jgi:hypothetical protein
MDDVQRKRLEELLKAKADKQAKQDEADQLRQLEEEELSVKLEQELGGPRGDAFEVINNRFGGVFAIKRPDVQAIRNWEKADEKKKVNTEWQIGLMRHYIAPAEKQIAWAQVCADRPAVCWQTAEAFVTLMGIDRRQLDSK